MIHPPLTDMQRSATRLLERRALSVYATRELLNAAEELERWLEGEGPDDDEVRRVDRITGAVETLRSVEGSA